MAMTKPKSSQIEHRGESVQKVLDNITQQNGVLSSSSVWEEVPRLKGGDANKQSQALANRTQFLRDSIFDFGAEYSQNEGDGFLYCALKAAGSVSRVIQSATYDTANNLLYTLRSNSVTGDEEQMIVEEFRIARGGSYNRLRSTVPTTAIGHQGLACQIVRNGARYFWAPNGSADNKVATRFVRFQLNQSTFEIFNTSTFKLFPEDGTFSVDNPTSTINLSHNGKLLIAYGVRASDMARVIRVFDAHIFVYSDGGDFSEQYLYEFALDRPYQASFASIATDGQFVYTLSSTPVTGSTSADLSAARNTLDVYTIDGRPVIKDAYMRIGLKTAQSQVEGDALYEPEGLFFIPTSAGTRLAVISASAKNSADTYRTNNIHTIFCVDGVADDGDVITPTRFRVALLKDGAGVSEIFKVENNIARLSGDGLSDVRIEVSTTATRQPQIRVVNASHSGMMQVSSSGAFGLFSTTHNRYLVRIDLAGVQYHHYTATVFDTSGTGSPEGVVSAAAGSTYRNLSGGAGSTFYVKESGVGATGWVAK